MSKAHPNIISWTTLYSYPKSLYRYFCKLSIFKRCFIYALILICVVTVICKNTSHSSKLSQKLQAIDPTKVNNAKYILLWTPWCAEKWPVNNLENTALTTVRLNQFIERECEVSNCVITSSRVLLRNITEFDALLFHGAEGRDLFLPLPEHRSPHQIYIMGNLEPPHSFREVSDKNLYNWTMSYKLNSDIVWTYMNVYDKITNEEIAPNDEPNWRPVDESFHNETLIIQIKKKTKMAVQFVSNCNNAKSNRANLTAEISKFIEVDVYGRCGILKCDLTDTHCETMLDDEYRFYLAFENEFSQDYVTEKLFRSLNHTIIPIVYGAANYSRFAPPHSYINTADFKTVEELTKYLIYLSKNPEQYAKYFWWKNYYRLAKKNPMCDVCAKLNDNIEKTQVYDDILHWTSETLL